MDNKNHGQDDYLSLKSYFDKPPSKSHKGFSTFEQDGDFYFALLDTTGNVFMRSEGYSSPKARDNGMDSVNKNKTIPERWKVEEAMKRFFLALKAGNHQEIARSGGFNSKADAEAALAAFMSGKSIKGGQKSQASKSKGTTAALGATAAGITGKIISESRGEAKEVSRKVINETRGKGKEKSRALGIEKSRSVINEKRNVLSEKKSKVKEDDYLECKAYEGHKITDQKNKIAKFKGKDGQFYFAAYRKDGSVRLRSEGFKTEAGRDSEIKAVLTHMETEDQYSTIKRDGLFMNVLKDKTGREVARSCGSKEVQERVAYIAPVIAAAAATIVTKKVEKKKVEKKVVAAKPTPPPPKVVPVAPIVAEKAASGGCLKFWPLLLLLLIPLIWLLFKGCPPPAAAPVAAPVAVVPPPPPPPPPPPAPVCNCSDLTHPMFKIPSGPAPKTLTKLGLAPEYGNCHGLTPKTFYDKLNASYKNSTRDRRFLNTVATQLGFVGGWADVKPSDIIDERVPRGVTGNMGTLRSHETVHRKLDPTNPRDLESFKIMGKNVCNIHFMKTCGNHFFFQQCER